ncbi:MAG: DUF4328 domain-containing protein [Erythrobacter sp.]|nr:DUF4328 domain-containing protein [Erythrobacter sp.]
MSVDGMVSGISTLMQRARAAVFAMYATMAIFTLTMLGEMLELRGVIALEIAPEEPLALAYTVILLVNFVIYFGSVIAVGMWIHRAHANLHEAGIPGLEFSPGWAVGWYFIPIAFLFKPFQAMRELWNASHQTGNSLSAPAPGNLSLWWGLWIISNILANISTRMSLFGDGSNFQVAAALNLGSSICTIGSAWLLLQIIRAITTAQADGIAVAQIFE